MDISNISIDETYDDGFERYVKGKLPLTPVGNIFRKYKKIKRQINEYILNNIDHSTLSEYLILDDEKNRLFIYFFTMLLDEKNLHKMFGEPIKHVFFGENFEEKREYDCCSYFIKIRDSYYHLCYDHKGTTFECMPDISEEKLYEDITIIITIFKEKCTTQ